MTYNDQQQQQQESELIPFRYPSSEGFVLDRRFNRVRGRDERRERGNEVSAETRDKKSILSEVFGFDITKSYGGKTAPRSSALVDMVSIRLGARGDVLGLSVGKVIIVKKVGDRFVKLNSGQAAKWFADNSRLISKARTEWENRSNTGRVARVLYEEKGVDRPITLPQR